MNIQNQSARFAIVTAAIAGLMLMLASGLYLYSYFWWYDDVIHFLCGSLVAYAFFIFKKDLSYVHKRKDFWYIVIFALAVGLTWEIFEKATNNIIGGGENYWLDTTADLCEDVLGAVFGYFLVSKKIKS